MPSHSPIKQPLLNKTFHLTIQAVYAYQIMTDNICARYFDKLHGKQFLDVFYVMEFLK